MWACVGRLACWTRVASGEGEQMSKAISYSDGRVVENPVVQIWDDLHNERAGYFRAFWCASADATSGSPVIGYCSLGGSHRTIRATVAEVRQYYPDAEIYRNGRAVSPVCETCGEPAGAGGALCPVHLREAGIE